MISGEARSSCCRRVSLVMGTKKGKKAVKAGDTAMEVDAAEVQVQPEVVMKKEERVETKVKAKSEIDDIFGQKKRKKVEGDDIKAVQVAAKKKEKDNSEAVRLNSKGELVKPKKPKSAKPVVSAKSTPGVPASRKRTEDGFVVYSEEELGFNRKNAGGSALCPFDCDCCF